MRTGHFWVTVIESSEAAWITPLLRPGRAG